MTFWGKTKNKTCSWSTGWSTFCSNYFCQKWAYFMTQQPQATRKMKSSATSNKPDKTYRHDAEWEKEKGVKTKQYILHVSIYMKLKKLKLNNALWGQGSS